MLSRNCVIHLTVTLLLVLPSWSCRIPKQQGKKESAESVGVNPEKGNNPTDDPSTPPPEQPPATPQGPTLVTKTYHVSATALGFDVCDQDIQVEVNREFLARQEAGVLKFANPVITCSFVGKIDLAQALSGIVIGSPLQPKLTVQDQLLVATSLGDGAYEPARPYFPDLVKGDAQIMATYKKTATITLEDKKTNKKEKLTVVTNVTAMDKPFTTFITKKTYPKTRAFKVVIDGVDEANKLKHFLFDQLTMRVALDPAELVSLEFTGSVAKMVESGRSSTGGGNSDPEFLEGLPTSTDDDPLASTFGSAVETVTGLVGMTIRLELAEKPN